MNQSHLVQFSNESFSITKKEIDETYARYINIANQFTYQEFCEFFKDGLMPRMNHGNVSFEESLEIELFTPLRLLFTLTSKYTGKKTARFTTETQLLKNTFPSSTETLFLKNGVPLVCCQVYPPSVSFEAGSESFLDIFSHSVYRCISANTPYGLISKLNQTIAFKLELTDEEIKRIKSKTESVKMPEQRMKTMCKSVKVKSYSSAKNETSAFKLQGIMITLIDMAEKDLSTHAGRAKNTRLLKNLSSALKLTKQEKWAMVDKELDDSRNTLSPKEECQYWELKKSDVTVVKQGEVDHQEFILNQAGFNTISDKPLKSGSAKYLLKIFDPVHAKRELEGVGLSKIQCWKRAHKRFKNGNTLSTFRGSIAPRSAKLYSSGYCHLKLEGLEESLGGWFLLHQHSEVADVEAAFEAQSERNRFMLKTLRDMEKQYPNLSHSVTDLGNGKFFLGFDGGAGIDLNL